MSHKRCPLNKFLVQEIYYLFNELLNSVDEFKYPHKKVAIMIKSLLKSTHINTLFLCCKNNQSCLECGICQTEMDDPSKH